jgi:hypothetical protein
MVRRESSTRPKDRVAYGADAMRGDIGAKTLPGLALYLLLYSLLAASSPVVARATSIQPPRHQLGFFSR